MYTRAVIQVPALARIIIIPARTRWAESQEEEEEEEEEDKYAV